MFKRKRTVQQVREEFLNLERDIKEKLGYGFWSMATCPSCSYDLESNHSQWYKKTGCPNCHYSFVE